MSVELETRTARALADFAGVLGAAPRVTPLMPPVIMPMHQAIDAHPFRVESAAGVFFLKLHAEDMLPFIDLPAAIAASRQAGETGIGPSLLAESRETGALLFEWSGAPDWRMPSRRDLTDPGLVAAIIDAKKNWHGTAPLPRAADPFARLWTLRDTLAQLEDALPAPLALPLLMGWAERIEAAIRAAGVDAVPLHGEHSITNVLLHTDGAVRLVDFDQAGNGDRFYDLAGLALEFCSFDDEVEALVERYLGHRDAAAVARVHLYRMIDDLVWGCWALVAQARSPRSNKIEFYKYAQNRFVRCQYWLGIREFDTLLRQL